ncbi:MAG TPA: hypothetical protein DCK99_09110 [Blastocatellia bacterium]|nr:hypothetical protein [Blastocatellia bacterium]
MSTYFNAIDTDEGPVHILTKSRWLGIFPNPHTSVMPHHATSLKRLGTVIRWTTSDAGLLATLHNATVRLVQELGISGLADVANSAKMSQRVWKTLVEPAPG